MPAVLIALLPCLLLGLALGWRWPGLSGRLAPPLIHWGVPLALVGLLLRVEIDPDLLVTGLLALLISGGGLALVAGLAPLRRWLPVGPLTLGAVVGNTAYWGLPVAMALLPAAALPHAITYDLVGTLVTWSVGPLLLHQARPELAAIGRLLLTSPASRGLLLAVALQHTPWRPELAALLWWPARGLMLLALAMVGMRLATLSTAAGWGPRGSLPAALVTKLLILPALVLLLSRALGLAPAAQGALVLQAAAPTAVSVLLLAEATRCQVPAATALVLWSTLLALISVPLWSLLLPLTG